MRKPLAGAVLALALAATPALAQQSASQQSARPAPLDRAGALILTRQALAALDQANRTGNYTVLRDLGGPAFQANTAARLAEIFAGLRNEKVDLSPALVLEPVITAGPQLDAKGVLMIAGYVPTYPRQLNFQVASQSVGGEWKLYGVSVSTSAPQPTPTMRPPPAR